jgi:lysophospholipase L1-like esterase
MSGDTARHARIIRTIGTACDAVAIVSLLFVVADGMLRAAGDTRREQVRWTIAGIAAGLILLRRIGHSFDARVTLAGFTVLASVAAALAAFSTVDIDALARLRASVLGAVGGWQEPAGIYRLDDRLGIAHVPNARAVHRTAEFSVTYSIGGDGWRVTPSPQEPVDRAVAIVGDSFTFGWGVADHETYPAVLAAGAWRDRRVINASASGWGLTQLYVTVQDLLAGEPRPDEVIVSIIADDLKRSHLRPPYPPEQRRRLEFIEGALVSRRLEPGPDPEETPRLLDQEAALARSTLLAMARACADRGAALTVVLLDDGVSGPFPASLPYALGAARVRVLDLTRLPLARHGKDRHPNAAGHRAIAHAIASFERLPATGY